MFECTLNSTKLLVSCYLLSTLISPGAHASLALPESHFLSLTLRQLDSIERLARDSEALSPPEHTRYTFDYQRLINDIDLIRQGIRAYQSPARAQPRTPPELSGDYTREASPAP